MQNNNFFNNLNNYRNRPICTDADSGKSIFYNDISNEIKKIQFFIEKRCLVFLICSNTISFLSIYLALMRIKVVPLLLNEKIHISLLNKLIKIYQPNFVFAPKNIKMKTKCCFYNEFYDIYKNSFPFHEIDKRIALLISTSGSTGSKKNVVCSYENIFFISHSISKYLKISSADRPIMTLPTSYVYGLSVINSHLYKFATIYFTSKSLINLDFWKRIKKYKISAFATVPFQLDILNRIQFEKFDLNYLKYITVAGGKASISILKKIYKIFDSKNIKLIPMYGQAEATSRITYLSSEYLPEKIGSIGKAIPGGKLFLIDKKKKLIKKSKKIGQLVYRGKNIMLKYANSYKDLIKIHNVQKELYTGDLAYKDKNGFYYLVGRISRQIKFFGNRVNLDEVEAILFEHGIDCRCVGKENKIAIFYKNSNLKYKILQKISSVLNINAAYVKLFRIDKFFLNSNIKTNYTKLKKMAFDE